MNESAEIPEPPSARQRPASELLGSVPWLLPAIAAFAVVCLLLAAVGLGFALSGRSSSGAGLSSTVIPPRTDAQTSVTADASRAATASGAAVGALPAAASTSL